MHQHHLRRRHARPDHLLHGPRGPHRGGSRRFLSPGELPLLLLRLLEERPRHGYDLLKAIEEATGGAYAPSPGIIYPTLAMLEEMGRLQAAPDAAGRRLHALTPEGAAALAAERAAAEALLLRLAEAGRRAPRPEVVRAMENLKTALRLRLSGPPLDAAQSAAVAAALDVAALALERA
ncbi:PadR family transcriptional regulator [Roseococcus sp. DSY-14]|uniref:PadR family transcriptional regulator n=1 Tax=Roseococcus sp. DSY-14 TaxID=3369650 RepID=UPI00387A8ADA